MSFNHYGRQHSSKYSSGSGSDSDSDSDSDYPSPGSTNANARGATISSHATTMSGHIATGSSRAATGSTGIGYTVDERLLRTNPHRFSRDHDFDGDLLHLGTDRDPDHARSLVIGHHLRLFGQLPDIVRLQEQTGDFDGQVVFIGHPNRDVSAHQWLSDSYQWVHIGLWSHTRKRIEGSLSSDRLIASEFPYESIEYFKHVAEHRESLVKEHGRSEADPEIIGTDPPLSNTNTANISEAIISDFAATTVPRNVIGETLEDPFVTHADPSQPAPIAASNFRGGSDEVGSLNFNYQFPRKPGTANTEHHQVYVQRERVRLEALRGLSITPFEMHPPLREIGFYEEAADGFTPPTARVKADKQDTASSANDLQIRLQAQSRLTESGQTTRRPSLTPEQRVAIPDLPTNLVNLRNSIPPGLTIANPYRGGSTLNAAAPPYRMTNKEQKSEASDSSVATLNTHVPATDPALRFSDPDGIRQEHVHPIANGFNKQTPTRQIWNGPFFADCMPTAHNPLALHSIQTSNEQRLTDWYRDGQSVSRQQDYAKTLIAATSASNKVRSLRAIGESSARKQDPAKYANTHLFARVYECLYEYAEDSRAGGGQSYFMRAWKPPHLHLRDLGPNGNNSFYGSVPSTSSHILRASSQTYQPYRRESSPWGIANTLISSQHGSSTAAAGLYDGPLYSGF